MFFFYNFLAVSISLVIIPVLLLLGLRENRLSRGLSERLGFYRQLKGGKDSPLIWIHAASVGEVRAAVPLIGRMRQRYPGHRVLVTTLTTTGRKIARELNDVDIAVLAPLDLPLLTGWVVRKVDPDVVCIVETELWPNIIHALYRRRVPVFLINGRISDRSFPRYQRLKTLLQPLLRCFSGFCMQNELDAERIRELGADPEKIVVTHNIKFDIHLPSPVETDMAFCRKELGLPSDAFVLVAGSTHPGEDEQLLTVYRRLLRQGARLCLILVPRHRQRFEPLAERLQKESWTFHRRSEGTVADVQVGDVYLGDSLGEMHRYYVCSDLVFVGGSLVKIGGHNLLEASLLAKPVLFGPHMFNFKEIARMILDYQGGLMVRDIDQLQFQIEKLMDDPQLCREMGINGRQLLKNNAGATEQTLECIDPVMRVEK